MDRILEKYGLQERTNLISKTTIEDIVHHLKFESNGEYYSILFAFTDIFNPKHQKFVGTVSDQGFKVRKRLGFANFFPNWAVANGEFLKTENGTEISMTINGMNKISFGIRLVVFAILCLIAGLVIIEISIEPIGQIDAPFELFFPIMVGFIFVVVPIVRARWNVNRLKRDLNIYFE